jgi:hypothetical protein
MVNAHGSLLTILTPITLAADSNNECRAFLGRYGFRSGIRNLCDGKRRSTNEGSHNGRLRNVSEAPRNMRSTFRRLRPANDLPRDEANK